MCDASEKLQLLEVVSAMEKVLSDNEELHCNILELLKKKKVNDAKVVTMVASMRKMLENHPKGKAEVDETAVDAKVPITSLSVRNHFVNIARNVFSSVLRHLGTVTGILDGNKILEVEEAKNVKVLDSSYFGKTPVNSVKAGQKTISDAENLITNPGTKIFIEYTDQAGKYQITPSESFEEVVNDNRLMIKPSDSFGNNINNDLTGFRNNNGVETSTPLDLTGSKVSGLFVFSAAKKADDTAVEDVSVELSMLSLMNFHEKEINSSNKIEEMEATAKRENIIPCKEEAKSPVGPSPHQTTKSLLSPPHHLHHLADKQSLFPDPTRGQPRLQLPTSTTMAPPARDGGLLETLQTEQKNISTVGL